MRLAITLIFLLFLIFPLKSNADFIVFKPTGEPFDNVQNLTLKITKTDTSEAITNHGTTTLPVNSPVSISYAVNHKPFWPNYRVNPSDNDSLFTEVIKTNKLYLELWQGAPFTESAQLLQNWDISNNAVGQVTAILPSAGQYFLVTYLPSGYYQDPQTGCSDDPNWQVDCVPSYTLDQMRGYFTHSATSSDELPYMPDAFGGITFNVLSNEISPKNSNVLFLPGIEGSRLYSRNALGIETTLWEPPFLSNFSDLALNPDGKSKYEIYTRDLVNYKYGIKALGDVYGPFEDFLNHLVTQGVISKWEAFPYDWRYDVRDIVSNGTLIGTNSGELTRTYLQDVVQKLASSSPTGKVTIIAHSNGGLLAKALAIELEKERKINLLDQIIFVGSPQIGTPLSIGALLNGDGQTDALGGFFMYGGNVRAAAATMPGMYGLLPSANYFSLENPPPVLFTQKPQGNLFSNYFGSMITSESALENFLTDVSKLHDKFFVNDLRTPQILSDALLEKEFETHAVLDAWEPPRDLRLSFIAGWGNLTASQYLYETSDKKFFDCVRASFFLNTCSYAYDVWHTTKNSFDGDDTVISSSALANGTTSQKFYFNAKDFQRDKLMTIGHGNLTSATSVQTAIENILTGVNQNIPYITNTPPPEVPEELTSISVHSPVNIIATDADGNQTGIFPIPGKSDIFYEKENIPGSYLQTLDDEKYLYLPKTQSYTVSLQGYADGFMTLDFGSVSLTGDASTSIEFSGIPVTASTTAEIGITSVSSSSPSLLPQAIQIDIFGNGSTTEFRSEGSDGVTLTPENIDEILRKEFTKLAVRRGIKNRFLSVLKKIIDEPDRTAQQTQISYLEKLVLAQMDIKLSHEQGMFFMRLLEQLKN
jgi:hypothetical protein